MKSRRRLLLALVLLASRSLSAQVYSFELDAAETAIDFVVDATLHKVHGTAKALRGQVRIDSEGGQSDGEVVVDALSLETGNARRDKQMHRRVLESETFPEIVLVIDGLMGQFEAEMSGDLEVSARLRLHGGEHPLTLPVSVEAGAGRLRFQTRFVVPYVAWGLKNPSKLLLRVGKEVEVSIDAAGALVPLAE